MKVLSRVRDEPRLFICGPLDKRQSPNVQCSKAATKILIIHKSGTIRAKTDRLGHTKCRHFRGERVCRIRFSATESSKLDQETRVGCQRINRSVWRSPNFRMVFILTQSCINYWESYFGEYYPSFPKSQRASHRRLSLITLNMYKWNETA